MSPTPQSPPRGHDARVLAELAQPLEPTTSPRYVCGAAFTGHPDGWYWQPAGAERLQFLGRSVIFAARQLSQLLTAGVTGQDAAMGGGGQNDA